MSIQVKQKATSFSSFADNSFGYSNTKSNIITIESEPKKEPTKYKEPQTYAELIEYCISKGAEMEFTKFYQAACKGRCINGIISKFYLFRRDTNHKKTFDTLISRGIQIRAGCFKCEKCQCYVGNSEDWFAYHLGYSHTENTLSDIVYLLKNTEATINPSDVDFTQVKKDNHGLYPNDESTQHIPQHFQVSPKAVNIDFNVAGLKEFNTKLHNLTGVFNPISGTIATTLDTLAVDASVEVENSLKKKKNFMEKETKKLEEQFEKEYLLNFNLDDMPEFTKHLWKKEISASVMSNPSPSLRVNSPFRTSMIPEREIYDAHLENAMRDLHDKKFDKIPAKKSGIKESFSKRKPVVKPTKRKDRKALSE